MGENLLAAVRVAAFLCELAVFWWEIPRDPYMVKAKWECEAEDCVICYHSQRLQRESKALFRRISDLEMERYARYAGIPMQTNTKDQNIQTNDRREDGQIIGHAMTTLTT